MSHRVLLAIEDTSLQEEARALVEEGGALMVAGVATTAGEVLDLLGSLEVDVVLLHDALGPLPLIDLAREIDQRFPDIGLILIAREPSPDMLRSVLETGVRGLVSLPLSLEEVQGRAIAAAIWARTVRQRLSGDADDMAERAGGVMVAVAGAKGGVGASTVSVHLAFEAARAVPPQSVCLIDFDLQAGDVPALMDINHRRSVMDLLPVVDDLTARHLSESLYTHPSGLRVLLAPLEGERGEEVTASAARLILGGIRSRFDVVIVDCGSVMTEASAVAIELADRSVVVTTSDVPALRAANRQLALWERLRIRKAEDSLSVLNRTSKKAEVQPDLARRVLNAPLAKSILPAAYFHLEPAASTGVPSRLGDKPLAQALADLAHELTISPERTVRGRRRLGRSNRARRSRRDRVVARPPTTNDEGSTGSARRSESGQAAVETVGISLLVLVVIGLLWEIALAGYSFALAGHAAREGARLVAVHDSRAQQMATDSLPGAWRNGAQVDVGADSVTVTVQVPVVFPGLGEAFTVSSTEGTSVEPAP